MRFTQHYLDCLSQASYFIGDETSGQAVVVDPRRDVSAYLEEAAEQGVRIIGIINTHFHADFVSGHLELATQTGAWIGYGEAAEAEFEFRSLRDAERINLGDVVLEIMTTPGHTPESISIQVFEHADDAVAYGVLTGDALFIGDVGRPDLLASSGTTAAELGAALFDSVQRKLMGLDDSVRLFPGHGAGSACGKNLLAEKQSTIGEQRRTNYACKPMTQQQFVEVVTTGQTAAPAYFAFDAAVNKRRHPVLDETVAAKPLDATEFATAIADGVRVLDVRSVEEYTDAHLIGSLSVPFDGRTAETVGMLLEPSDPIVLITPDGLADETRTRLARIGYDNVRGYLDDPKTYFAAHPEQLERSSRLNVDELDELPADVQLIDVRGPGEVADGMIPGAVNIPLPQLASRASEVDRERPVVVYCAGGWRSNVAASFLRGAKIPHISDVRGGYNAWASARRDAR